MVELKRVLSLVMPAAILLAPGAQGGPTFDRGLKHFKGGRYRHAVLYLALAAEEEPGRAVVHYYLASALARSGRQEQAVEEYGLCYRLAPRGKLANYCRQALARYNQQLPAGGGSPTTGGGVPASSGRSTIATSDEDELVERTKSHIKQEVIYEKSKHERMGECFASSALKQAECEVRRIQEETARELEEAMTPPMMVIGCYAKSLALDPQLVRARVEQIKRKAAERVENARKFGQARADMFKRWSKERQVALDDVAANLQTQLEQPVVNGGVKLQPVGTDLYTRYYGAWTASSQLPDSHRAAVNIIEQPHSLRAAAESLRAGDERFQPTVVKSVRGRLLR